eukprot:TRINITY_DN14563_c0_g1_i1.p1 TRINITY_DN14563_c0_g1~~TRINITY_DN14563_c0_g1_i1.p1  ORF type:complete len:670 (+),score=165.73 TRINITY_DN14563_c0_g1_i1:93-2012(+)
MPLAGAGASSPAGALKARPGAPTLRAASVGVHHHHSASGEDTPLHREQTTAQQSPLTVSMPPRASSAMPPSMAAGLRMKPSPLASPQAPTPKSAGRFVPSPSRHGSLSGPSQGKAPPAFAACPSYRRRPSLGHGLSPKGSCRASPLHSSPAARSTVTSGPRSPFCGAQRSSEPILDRVQSGRLAGRSPGGSHSALRAQRRALLKSGQQPAGGFWDSYAQKVGTAGNKREPMAPGALTLLGGIRTLGKDVEKARVEADQLRDGNEALASDIVLTTAQLRRRSEAALQNLQVREGHSRRELHWAMGTFFAAMAVALRSTAPEATPEILEELSTNRELHGLLQAECKSMRAEIRRIRRSREEAGDSPGSPLSRSFAEPGSPLSTTQQLGSAHEEAALAAETEAHVAALETELLEAQLQLDRVQSEALSDAVRRALSPQPPAAVRRTAESSTGVTSLVGEAGDAWLLEGEAAQGYVDVVRVYKATSAAHEYRVSEWSRNALRGVAQIGEDSIRMPRGIEGSAALVAVSKLCRHCGVADQPQSPRIARRSSPSPRRDSSHSPLGGRSSPEGNRCSREHQVETRSGQRSSTFMVPGTQSPDRTSPARRPSPARVPEELSQPPLTDYPAAVRSPPAIPPPPDRRRH